METKIYAEVLEEKALAQFNEAMKLECNVQGALMPDAHTGYTLPIGAVIKSKDMVFPSYVGYDIGCGVCATKLNITKDELDLEALRDYIVKTIPVGFNKHEKKQSVDLDKSNLSDKAIEVLEQRGLYQLGTLGGGNHFIELGESDIDGSLWIVIHSGSRGLGHGIAEHYMKEAASVNAEPFDGTAFVENFAKNNEDLRKYNKPAYDKKMEKQFSVAHEKHLKNIDTEGHFGFDINSDIGKAYLNDMEYTLEFALANRARMIDNIIKGIQEQKPCAMMEFINRNHNHAELKDGHVIHRKGATHAEKDMLGVIPANMKDGSFIVKGKGAVDSMCSSSHGAGRVLSRSQAVKTLDVDEFMRETECLVTNHTEKMLDESPKAYKNIHDVMRLQEELVEVIDRSIPILNIKG